LNVRWRVALVQSTAARLRYDGWRTQPQKRRKRFVATTFAVEYVSQTKSERIARDGAKRDESLAGLCNDRREAHEAIMIAKSLSHGVVAGFARRHSLRARREPLAHTLSASPASTTHTRCILRALLFAAISFPLAPAFAQSTSEDIFKDGFEVPPPPPPNDTCASAQPLVLSTPANGTTANATNDYDSGLETCTGFPQAGSDVAYSILLISGSSVTVTLSNVYPALDASISLLGPGTPSVCNASPVTCLKGADQNNFGVGESFTYSVQQSGTYYIIVDSYYTGSGSSGPFTIEVTSP
jgi:hypothetical protein